MKLVRRPSSNRRLRIQTSATAQIFGSFLYFSFPYTFVFQPLNTTLSSMRCSDFRHIPSLYIDVFGKYFGCHLWRFIFSWNITYNCKLQSECTSGDMQFKHRAGIRRLETTRRSRSKRHMVGRWIEASHFYGNDFHNIRQFGYDIRLLKGRVERRYESSQCRHLDNSFFRKLERLRVEWEKRI